MTSLFCLTIRMGKNRDEKYKSYHHDMVMIVKVDKDSNVSRQFRFDGFIRGEIEYSSMKINLNGIYLIYSKK